MPPGPWGPSDIPDLNGATSLVTGSNSGIGYETALELAAHGASVVLACRNETKGTQALERIAASVPGASLELLELDLSSPSSVQTGAQRFAQAHDRLDLLVNNAGVMATPLEMTDEGVELQFATNHLGHFALTGLLLGHLLSTPRSRVVNVTSIMHRMGRVLPPDPTGPRPYNPWTAYGASKLANLLFTHELERRLERIGTDTIAVAAHPGWTRSNLAGSGPVMGRSPTLQRLGLGVGHRLGQPTRLGALPTLRAGTAPGVRGGECYGPGGPLQLFGPPVLVETSPASHRRDLAADLWATSERLSKVTPCFEVEPTS